MTKPIGYPNIVKGFSPAAIQKKNTGLLRCGSQ